MKNVHMFSRSAGWEYDGCKVVSATYNVDKYGWDLLVEDWDTGEEFAEFVPSDSAVLTRGIAICSVDEAVAIES